MTAPTITSASTGTLPTNALRIHGTGFTGATAVLFGPAAASSFTVVSDTTIVAISPSPLTPGPVDITVTTPGGSITAAVLIGYIVPTPVENNPAARYLGSFSTESAMTALPAQVGDYCYRADLGMLYYLLPAGNMATWSGLTVPITSSELSSDVQANLSLAAGAMRPLSTVTILTASTSPGINQTTYYNATSGNLTPTFPALSGLSVGERLAVRRDPADTSTNTVTLSCAGSDTFYSSNGTSTTLPMSGEEREYQVISVSGTKYWAPSGSVNPVSSLDSRYLSVPGAADYGWRGWSHDIVANTATGVQPVAGTVYLTYLPIRTKQTITNIVMGIITAGASMTSGENFVGLFQNGTFLASSADQSTAWQSTGTKTMALSSPQLVDPANGTVYAAFFNNGTTRPFVAQASVGGGLPFLNPSFKRYPSDLTNTGRTTSFQTTLGTLSSNSPLWVAWS